VNRRGGVAASIGFAGVAALCAIVAVVALEPWVGHWRARALFALALLPFAGIRFAPSLGAAARAGSGLVLVSLALGLAHLPWPALALPLAGAYGVTRALSAGGRAPGRALALECVLLAAGLALGAVCEGRSTLSFGLAVWAFLLVQAAFPLAANGPAPNEAGDPFERARDRALALLERRPL
jgi:hypothetical protein